MFQKKKCQATVNWKIVFLLLLDEEPASASMTAFFHFQINAGPRGDDEACLAVTDVVRLPGWLRLCQGRGHGWQGWKPWGKDKNAFQKTFIWRITSLSSVQSIVKNRFRIWSHITLTGLMEKLTIGIGWTGTFYWYWVSLKTTSWTQFIFPLAFCTNHHQGLILTLSIFSCPGTLLFLTKARFGSALVAGGILGTLVVSTCCICCCLHYKRRKAEERRRQEEEEEVEEKRKDREDSGRGHDEGRRVSSNTNTY